jgi:hypothetical protein
VVECLQDPEIKPKYNSKQRERKVYFSSQFWRFQFMVSWLHCFWACHEGIHHGGSVCLNKIAPLIARSQRRGKGTNPSSTIRLEGSPQCLSGGPTISQYHHGLRTKSLTHDLLGNTYLNHSNKSYLGPRNPNVLIFQITLICSHV